MHYERDAKKILRFFREEFNKVRFQKVEEGPRGGGEVRQRRHADLHELRWVERQNAHAARKGAAIERVVHGEAETGLHHRIGRKGVHRGEFQIWCDAAARENARIVDILVGIGLDIRLSSKRRDRQCGEPCHRMRGGNPGGQCIVTDTQPVVSALARGDEAQVEPVRVELVEQLCAVSAAQLHLNMPP